VTRRAGKTIKPGMLVIHYKWAEKGYVPAFVLSAKPYNPAHGPPITAVDTGHSCDVWCNMLYVDKAGTIHIRDAYWCSCCLDVLSE
jgi:hypothetical protein